MSFVQGHARDAGWVVAHIRPPTDAEDGQLQLPLPAPDEEDEAQTSARNAVNTSSHLSSASMNGPCPDPAKISVRTRPPADA